MRGYFLGVWRCKRLFRLSEDVESDLMGCGVTIRSTLAKNGDVAWRACWKKPIADTAPRKVILRV